MGTITQNLEKLVAAKSAIATAIKAKDGIVGANDGFEEFAAAIATIPYESFSGLGHFIKWDDSWTLENFQSITGAIYYTKSNLPESISRQANDGAWIIYNVDMSTSKFAIATYAKTGEFFSTTSADINGIKSQLTNGKQYYYFKDVS